MSDLKQQLIRLGERQPRLRKHLRPILDHFTKGASATDLAHEVGDDLKYIHDKATKVKSMHRAKRPDNYRVLTTLQFIIYSDHHRLKPWLQLGGFELGHPKFGTEKDVRRIKRLLKERIEGFERFFQHYSDQEFEEVARELGDSRLQQLTPRTVLDKMKRLKSML